MWKVLHDKIATNSLRATRGITKDASCKACGAAEETLIHVLRDCYLTRKVWNQLQPLSFKDLFFSLQEGDWVEINIIRDRNIALDNRLYWDT